MPLERQARLLWLILRCDALCRQALERGADVQALQSLPVREKLGRAKMAAQDGWDAQYAALEAELKQEIAALSEKEEEA